MRMTAILAAYLTCAGVAQADVVVREAAVVHLTRADLANVVLGLREELRAPLKGSIDVPRSFTFNGFGMDRLHYELRLGRLEITPTYGALQVRVEIADLSLAVDKIFLTDRPEVSCHGLRARSFQQPIRIDLRLAPRVDSAGRLQVTVPEGTIDVGERNLQFLDVNDCEGLGGLNGLAARIVPAVANAVRDRLGALAAAQLGTLASTLTQDLTRAVTSEFTLPFTAAPFGRHVAHVRFFPTRIDLRPDAATLVIGTHGRLDRSAKRREGSYVGISEAFVDGVLGEASRKGFFQARFDGETSPDYAPFFRAELVRELIPDAEQRFREDEPLIMHLRGIDGFDLTPDALSLAIRGVHLGIEVSARPYYEITFSGTLPMELSLDPDARKVGFEIGSLRGFHLDRGSFAPGLNPAPAANSGLTPEMFDETAATLDEVLQYQEGPLFALTLPTARLGNSFVTYRTLEYEEGVLALGVAVRR